MIKIVETKIKNLDGIVKYSSKAIITKKTIKYNENDFIVILKIDEDKITLKRQNNQISQKFIFKTNDKSTLTYKLVDNDYQFKLEFKTIKIDIKDNYIKIIYEIDANKFEYILRYKEVL